MPESQSTVVLLELVSVCSPSLGLGQLYSAVKHEEEIPKLICIDGSYPSNARKDAATRGTNKSELIANFQNSILVPSLKI